jgi:hypothetical protein
LTDSRPWWTLWRIKCAGVPSPVIIITIVLMVTDMIPANDRP